ncbi:ATP-binding protein [Dyella choica]|uniref:ATP-binding protein n=1 Tax=Dyella choica TaxID=1927959 RepID=A0A3S0PPS9_9GAMM|nr:ATP-binding protein [Dyella choica]RUL78933.1 ATP-binding protein [Dyella choica]
MSDYAQWLVSNEQYLANALADLRERLQRLAAQPGAAAAPAENAVKPSAMVATSKPSPTSNGKSLSWLSLIFNGHAQQAKPVAEVRPSATANPLPPSTAAPPAPASAPAPAPAPAVSEDQVPPALLLLAQRLGLSDFERQVLLLCIGMELDTRIPALCAQAQHDPGKPWPTFALALSLFDQPSWDALSPERPLRYWRLLDIHQPGPQPLVSAALSADERIVNFVKGLNHLDDRLAPLLTPLTNMELPASQQAVVDQLVEQLQHVPSGELLPAVQLIGADSASKQAIAQAVAAAFGTQALRLSAELLPGAVAEQETLLRLWHRESKLMPTALYLDANDVDGGDAAAHLIKRFLSRVRSLSFIDTREAWNGSAGNTLSRDVGKPTAVEQRETWQHLLGDGAEAHIRRLAGHFDFNLDKIAQVARTALATAGTDGSTLGDALWHGALARTRPALDQLAQRIEPKAGWDDLKLPETEKSLLRQISDQVAQRSTVYDDWGFRDRMNRGLSISALFAGESGTGKTMAAEVIAHELGLSLYRIDLSAVVSKYIGETEKNLRKLFDAAEEGGAILFFDEADALFGRRSEVKDSHDRYANIEVNYLLQRLESFRGLAVLATNMKNALDTAFMRRIRFIVNFPFPGVPQRQAIWSNAFPSKLATAGLDIERLAKLALTGGSIQGIALNAAFMAAKNGGQITMPLVLEAARSELRKLEKPINEADFRWVEPVGGKQ